MSMNNKQTMVAQVLAGLLADHPNYESMSGSERKQAAEQWLPCAQAAVDDAIAVVEGAGRSAVVGSLAEPRHELALSSIHIDLQAPASWGHDDFDAACEFLESTGLAEQVREFVQARLGPLAVVAKLRGPYGESG